MILKPKKDYDMETNENISSTGSRNSSNSSSGRDTGSLKSNDDNKNSRGIKLELSHNSLFVMGPDTNRCFTHAIKQDKRYAMGTVNIICSYDIISYDIIRILYDQ